MIPEPITTQVATTRSCKLWLREDGIVQVVDLPDLVKTLEDAKESMAVIGGLTRGQAAPVLVDIRAGLGADNETRAYYSSKENLKTTKAVALLVESPLTRLMANLFIGMNRPAIPTRMFTSEAEAVTWLKNYL